MNCKGLHGWPAIFFVLLLCCFGCTQASGVGPTGPVTYKEIVLDTYDPVTPGSPAPLFSTYMELWSSDGKTLFASDDAGSTRGIHGGGFALIDYTKGLPSGDYWVFVRESPAPTDPFGYAIRVLTAPSILYTGWGFGTYVTESTTDLPLTGGSGIPTIFKTIVFSNSTADKLNRYLLAGGVNWIKLTLP